MSTYPEYSWINSSIYKTLEEAEKNMALVEKLKMKEEIPVYFPKKHLVKNKVRHLSLDFGDFILECVLSEN